MSADASTLRRYVVPRLNLVDLAAKSGLREEEAKKLGRFLQATPPTSTSNVTTTAVFGPSQIDDEPPPRAESDSEEDEGTAG